MRLSQHFTKTIKDVSADETSLNAQLLIKTGYISKSMAGVYAFLPLGLRVLNNIEGIVRKHMDNIGGQEVLLNSLHPKSWWDTTDRWDNVDVLFKLKSQTSSEYGLAPTHEEQISPLIKQYISSYKDLPDYVEGIQSPLAVYQIQTKFRDELRSKAGIMRGREFRMKDLYDFHKTRESQAKYFELMTATYLELYAEMGLKAYAVDASGGDFSKKFSKEFQVICSTGEDTIAYSESTGFASNIEVLDESLSKLDTKPNDVQTATSAEVGNIFDLGDKFTKAFEITYTDEHNQRQYPTMGCHGIGTSRCMGVIAELYNDERGLQWPANVAPFTYHLVTYFNPKDNDAREEVLSKALQIYNEGLTVGEHTIKVGDVLWDDRDCGMGQKLTEADMIGCPYQIILTSRTLENGSIEIKNRATGESTLHSLH
jgi:prolyl-tRNA synthetase